MLEEIIYLSSAQIAFRLWPFPNPVASHRRRQLPAGIHMFPFIYRSLADLAVLKLSQISVLQKSMGPRTFL